MSTGRPDWNRTASRIPAQNSSSFSPMLGTTLKSATRARPVTTGVRKPSMVWNRAVEQE